MVQTQVSSSSSFSSPSKRKPDPDQVSINKRPRIEASRIGSTIDLTKTEKKRSLEDAVAKVKSLKGIEATPAPSKEKPPQTIKQPPAQQSATNEPPAPSPMAPAASLSPAQVATLQAVFRANPAPKTKKYENLARVWGIDKQVIIDWFKQKRDADLLSKSAVTNPKGSSHKSNALESGRRMRSCDRVVLTREQRWLLEASLEKGTSSPQVTYTHFLHVVKNLKFRNLEL